MSFPTPIPTFDCRGLNRRRGTRSGLSIVEVLTSIVVAMIGVFGVMVLIPFAVRQAQTGLDSDAAVTTARNAISQMEAAGMQFPQNWWLLDGGATRTYNPVGGDSPGVFSLDPLAVAEVGGLATPPRFNPIPADYTDAAFPFRITPAEVDGTPPFPTQQHTLTAGPAIENLGIPAATFNSPTGAVFDLEMARRMCRSANDLVFEEADVSLLNSGPPQIFDVDGGPQRRQSQGLSLIHI